MFGQSGVGVGGVGGGGVNRHSGVAPGSTTWTMVNPPSARDNPPAAHPDYILQLVSDVRNFADVLLTLKEAFQSTERVECVEVEERLAELLRVLKAVIGKHQALNSVEILSTAGTVIAKVKGVNFKEVNQENRSSVFREIYTSIDTLAFTFGNVVSDFLMGDVDSGSSVGPAPPRRSRSFENLSGDGGRGCGEVKDGLAEASRLAVPELTGVEKVDQALLKNDSGVESALLYAKAWSKYTKDVLAWVEKRLSLDMECAKSYAKMAESAKAVAIQQDYMPFRDIYVSAFKNEMEHSQLLLQTAAALQTNRFIQPLVARKNDLDRRRKELKEQWQREQKKMSEAESAVRKARLLQSQRREEYEKARNSSSRGGEDQPSAGGKSLEKKRRLEEEALLKAEEALEHCKVCVTDAGVKRQEMENAKHQILTQIRELVFQCDLTLKAVTVNWFQMLQSQAVSGPVRFQTLCDQVKQYEPGQCYSQFVHSLPKERVWLEALSQDSTGPSRTGISFHKRSLSSSHSHSTTAVTDGLAADDLNNPAHHRLSRTTDKPPNSAADVQGVKSQCPPQVWSCSSSVGGGGVGSDSESAGGSSETRSVDSPTASPGDFKRRLPRTPSTGTMSSADDLDEREPPSPIDNGLGEMMTETTSSPGPFRNTQMSKAAQTHKLRKLRAPSKCRECDSLVVFHGAECEECSVAVHKKCLETLAIQCGHKKLQGRLQLFGIDFAQAAKNSPDGIPFIIKKCTSEIESRALSIKGIYRVNGAKSRVEKLCQAFENGKDLVELSDLYPHDISNVLKLYLRQLPEPLILYRYYNEFIGLAKEAQAILVEEAESARNRPLEEEPSLSMELNRTVFKIRDLLRQLPLAHYRTLHFLITHLHRVTECAEENKMTASNLGIIFGPTLIKPRQTEAEVSLSSLVDYPYQALMVEIFITHLATIFDAPLRPVSPLNAPTPTDSPVPRPRDKDRLSRHSRSLLDIKEASKVYKRHSSVIPSTLSLDEVKELKPGDSKPGKEETTAVDCTDCLNGVGSAAEVQRSTLVFGKPGVTSITSGPVQLRTQRSRTTSRPISMPVDRLLNERNQQNSAERENVPAAIQEVTEPEKPENRYKSPFIHTHTLRRTWDRQYRHYGVTPRTAMIVANLPVSDGTDKTKPAAGAEPASGSGSGPALPKNNPHTVPIRTFRSSWRDASSGQSGEGPITFRQPRMLQPPPGTFYKPPSAPRSKPPDLELQTVTASSTSTSVTIATTIAKPPVAETRTVTASSPVTTSTVVTMVSLTMGAPVATLTVSTTTPTAVTKPTVTKVLRSMSEDGRSETRSSGFDTISLPTLSPPMSPSSTPEDLSPTEAKPVYQRQRGSRRIVPSETERREAHFV
ncbi:rho GTPase-activating protein 29 isoform X2 [Astyanax mexicanus]|uniref:rho GTPase-activating protein 29 isoform X2 n=1 Tax=Astyanax mexicanus TaxID=7994 RepID=UPI0020CAA99D|nr:rho GTPase-activating protein 29 isoform X2 [Astyanax mexicanus]